MSRFKNWKKPKIKHNKLTKWKWLVSYPKGLKLGKYTDIGAFTYIQARFGVEIQDNVQIGAHCSIYSHNTINNTKGRVLIKKGACIGAHTVILPNVVIGKGKLVKAGSVISKNV